MGIVAEDGEDDALERARLVRAPDVHHDAPAFGAERKAADAGAERGKRKRPAPKLVGELEAGTRRASDETGVGAQVLAHHRAVDHVPRGQPPTGGRHRRPDRDRALRHCLALDLVTSRTLERARHACAPPRGWAPPATPAPIHRWSLAAFATASMSSAAMSPATTSICTA